MDKYQALKRNMSTHRTTQRVLDIFNISIDHLSFATPISMNISYAYELVLSSMIPSKAHITYSF